MAMQNFFHRAEERFLADNNYQITDLLTHPEWKIPRQLMPQKDFPESWTDHFHQVIDKKMLRKYAAELFLITPPIVLGGALDYTDYGDKIFWQYFKMLNRLVAAGYLDQQKFSARTLQMCFYGHNVQGWNDQGDKNFPYFMYRATVWAMSLLFDRLDAYNNALPDEQLHQPVFNNPTIKQDDDSAEWDENAPCLDPNWSNDDDE